jgi:hypothetical protein
MRLFFALCSTSARPSAPIAGGAQYDCERTNAQRAQNGAPDFQQRREHP